MGRLVKDKACRCNNISDSDWAALHAVSSPLWHGQEPSPHNSVDASFVLPLVQNVSSVTRAMQLCNPIADLVWEFFDPSLILTLREIIRATILPNS
eukprot:6252758-Amphidinium_carterae.2